MGDVKTSLTCTNMKQFIILLSCSIILLIKLSEASSGGTKFYTIDKAETQKDPFVSKCLRNLECKTNTKTKKTKCKPKKKELTSLGCQSKSTCKWEFTDPRIANDYNDYYEGSPPTELDSFSSRPVPTEPPKEWILIVQWQGYMPFYFDRQIK